MDLENLSNVGKCQVEGFGIEGKANKKCIKNNCWVNISQLGSCFINIDAANY